ncbi:MAG TPA: SLBB domain-containing protein [Steroidobacteraceae bacterium]|jgi:protein involved in polysaccharide export with SLBB domain|nr:SLBB domain-containing protein [Steroidobacteraceae bacterium]
MKQRLIWAFLALSWLPLAGSAQSTQDSLQALKDTLGNGQQSGVLQDILGGGTQNGKKTEKKLETPETVRPPPENNQPIIDRDIKTPDDRFLRQMNQDPELRAGDSVMIEVRSIDEVCERYNLGPLAVQDQQATQSTSPLGAPNASPSQLAALNAAAASGGAGPLNNLSALSGNAIGGVGGIGGLSSSTSAASSSNYNWIDLSRCPLQTAKLKTDEETADEKRLQEKLLAGNPYKLNKFGVLELPGLPAMPLAGLTASEATKRLTDDSGLSNYFVRMQLLRLQPTGKEALKQFGYDLFEGVPSTFAPVSDIQVPVGYLVGPGDTLVIQLYGNEPATYELTVERDGRINFPKIGPIMVSGMTFDSARNAIQERVSKQLIGSRVSVTMGDLRSIRVFVLGDANKPGSYTVSGLSTMTNALFVSGGVKKIGSLRNIQLKRDGRLVSTLDLYDLLLHGDNSQDHQLLPDDVIFIPPIGKTVSVYGAVHRPAIYELKNETTADQAVELAGGLLPDADASRGELERILPSHAPHITDVNLTASEGRMLALDNGDKLRIPEIRPTLENSVKLSGYVFRPGAFAYYPGLRLSDILGNFGELRPEADLHYILIRRVQPPELNVTVVSADLVAALAARGSSADPELHPRDEIMVFNLASSRERLIDPIIHDLELQATPDKPEQVVTIEGNVKAPGKYPLESSMHVSDLIRAGGSLEDSAFRGQAELTRYAVINGDVRRTELIPVDLDAIRHGNRLADMQLRPYDTLTIKPIPMWKEQGTIEVVGEVRFPGKYPILQGETLHSVLVRAGGFDELAFPQGAVFLREELKKREKDQLDMLAVRLQGDLTALSLQAVAASAYTNAGGGQAATQGLVIGQQLLAQLHQAKPVGRLVINAEGAYKGPPGGVYDVVVRDGDKLVIPKKTQDVTILGEVQSPTSHVYEPGLDRDAYIQMSGGATQNADRKRIYVVRANGDVMGSYRHGWFRRSQELKIQPGDTIVVPLNTEKIPTLPLVQAITTIIYNLAIGYILVHTNL